MPPAVPDSEFLAGLARDWPPTRWRRHGVLVAVSGGPDSVALLRGLVALAEPQSRLEVAHFNHQWRPDDSDRDERFVRDLAARLGLACHVGCGAPPTSGRGQGWEALARQARYRFLVETAQSRHARYIVTAHTADDQIETVLARLIRGTGVDGLRGMPRLRRLAEHVALVRPLLRLTRAAVTAYLQSLGQASCLDTTNQDPRFLRGRIRTQLLPLLQSQFNPQIGDAVLRLAESAEETGQLLRDLVEPLLACRQVCTPDRCEFERAALVHLPSSLGRALLRRVWREQGWPEQNMNRRRWEELWTLAAGPAGAQGMAPGGIEIRVEDDRLIVTRKPNGTI